MLKFGRLLGLTSACCVLLPTASFAKSPSKAMCAQSYEKAQEYRAQGKLSKTERELSVCADAACPAFVRRDCERWFAEVERELPSVIIRPQTNAGLPDLRATVTLDGEEVSPGATLRVDPGPHQLVVRWAGGQSAERLLVVQQGVQEREVDLRRPAATTNGASDAAYDPVRGYAYAAWGLGAIGLGVFGVVGHIGRQDSRSLRNDCPNVIDGTPTPEQIFQGVCNQADSAEREADYLRLLTIADIGLATGIAAAVTGTVLYFLSDDGTEAGDPLQVDVNASASGGSVVLRGRF